MNDSDRLKIIRNPLPESDGKLVMQHLRPGLYLKLEDMHIEREQKLSMAFEPGIRLVFAFNGQTHIRIGRQEIRFTSEQQFSAALFPVLKSALGYKTFKRQHNKRELAIFLSQQWLEESIGKHEMELLQPILNDHLQPFYFAITPLIQQHLQRLCSDEYLNLKLLQQEALCLTLIHETLQILLPVRSVSTSKRLTQIADKIDLLLQLDEQQQLSIKQLAHQCHSNPSTIQRVFKQRHGITLGAYRRRLQLEQGRKALRTGATVVEAAEIAGYSHLQSFSDAFREEFGCLPNNIKRTIQKHLKSA